MGATTANNTATVESTWLKYQANFMSRDHFKCYGSPGMSTVLLSIEGVIVTPMFVGYIAVAVPGVMVVLTLAGLVWVVWRKQRGKEGAMVGAENGRESGITKGTNV